MFSVILKERSIVMLYDNLPPHIEIYLRELGVIIPKQPEPVVVRDFSFKMPILDENGEPDF